MSAERSNRHKHASHEEFDAPLKFGQFAVVIFYSLTNLPSQSTYGNCRRYNPRTPYTLTRLSKAAGTMFKLGMGANASSVCAVSRASVIPDTIISFFLTPAFTGG